MSSFRRIGEVWTQRTDWYGDGRETTRRPNKSAVSAELSSAVERNAELKSLIQQMEAHYDAQKDSDSEEAKPAETVPDVNLSPEIENFLNELGQRFDKEE